MRHDASTPPTVRSILDPAVASLRLGTVRALGSGAARELRWGLTGVSREVHRWRALAAQIPDPVLRADALGSLAHKRNYVDGAALFWTLPSRRNDELLALLVAYQTIANYLDYASERGAEHRGDGGGSLMLALVDAVDVDAPLHDYYADHPWTDDGGYLRALVLRCRGACMSLPRYPHARRLLLREARRGHALELCHDPNQRRRDAALAAFADREFGSVPGASWFELAGGPASLLTVIVLLALAADESSTDEDLHAALDAYCPWIATLSLMLDSYIDQVDDAETGGWSAIAYYPNVQIAQQRIAMLISRALRDAARLRHGHRHTLIIAMMIAMYLSSDSAVSGPLAVSTRQLRRAGGPLTRALVPVLRCWRILYQQPR
jgi:tetraprenyl-beta-curcumene synthase